MIEISSVSTLVDLETNYSFAFMQKRNVVR